MLLYDSRCRSMTVQIAALIGFLILFGWLISNTIENLSALGKPIEFGFLSESAGYDINERLIDYNSQDGHWRAAFVGLLNTLLVAFLGCVTATVTFVGVLRLSHNWLVSRLMTVYVELFRNVPVLLWIVFVMAIMIESLPSPRDFRGDDAAASMWSGDSVAVTNRGVYVPDPVFSRGLGDLPVFGGGFEISLDLVAIIVVLVAGSYAARFVRRRAEAIQNQTGVRPGISSSASWRCR
jgi:general L-amino acid transport system permease protein